MRKLMSLLIAVTLVVSMAVSPVCAGGGKNRGDAGAGEVDQGETGGEVGNAPDPSPGVVR
jgi:hypothetical protein